MRVDGEGNVLWDKTFGGNWHEEFNCVAPSSRGGFLLGCWSNSDAGFDKSDDSRNSDDFWVLEMGDSALIASRPVDLPRNSLSAAARPNPFSGRTTFAINLTKPAELTLDVRDLSGRRVALESFAAPSGNSEHTFNASDLSAGAYFYTLSAKDGRKAEGKLIVK